MTDHTTAGPNDALGDDPVNLVAVARHRGHDRFG